jgi:hypothetical protein
MSWQWIEFVKHITAVSRHTQIHTEHEAGIPILMPQYGWNCHNILHSSYFEPVPFVVICIVLIATFLDQNRPFSPKYFGNLSLFFLISLLSRSPLEADGSPSVARTFWYVSEDDPSRTLYRLSQIRANLLPRLSSKSTSMRLYRQTLMMYSKVHWIKTKWR